MSGLSDWIVGNALVTAGLAIVALVVTRFLRHRPAVVHVVWLLVLLKPLTPPLWQAPWLPGSGPSLGAPANVDKASPAGHAGDRAAISGIESALLLRLLADPEVARALQEPGRAAASRAPVTTPSTTDWRRLVGLILAGGAAIVLGVAAVRAWRFERLLRWAAPAPRDLRRRLDLLARRLGLARHPKPWIVPAAISPMLWGWWRGGRMLLPAKLLDRLDPDALDTLLLHELAHYARHDHWVRLIEMLVSAAYWWHPAVWLARRRLHRAEEECCDAWVVSALPERGRTYAAALIECLDFLAGTRPVDAPPAASGLSPLGELKRRVEMIMNARTPGRLSRRGRFAALAAALLLLPFLPTTAQDTASGSPGSLFGSMSASSASADEFVMGSAIGLGGGLSATSPLGGDASTPSRFGLMFGTVTCDELQKAMDEIAEIAAALQAVGLHDQATRLTAVRERLTKVAAERRSAGATTPAASLLVDRALRFAVATKSPATSPDSVAVLRYLGDLSEARQAELPTQIDPNGPARQSAQQAAEADRVKALEAKVDAMRAMLDDLLRRRGDQPGNPFDSGIASTPNPAEQTGNELLQRAQRESDVLRLQALQALEARRDYRANAEAYDDIVKRAQALAEAERRSVVELDAKDALRQQIAALEAELAATNARIKDLEWRLAAMKDEGHFTDRAPQVQETRQRLDVLLQDSKVLKEQLDQLRPQPKKRRL